MTLLRRPLNRAVFVLAEAGGFPWPSYVDDPSQADEWWSKCPLHLNQLGHTLRIREGDQGLLLKCLRGCAVKEVVARMHQLEEEQVQQTLGVSFLAQMNTQTTDQRSAA